ncbi:hypothetical protein EU527_04000 [Candidatus Thorarchaeota archaeon]|nr:MAG: hypothetical protein EU527_04000 [Candidatus Thorarchaeota archaeon]
MMEDSVESISKLINASTQFSQLYGILKRTDISIEVQMTKTISIEDIRSKITALKRKEEG